MMFYFSQYCVLQYCGSPLQSVVISEHRCCLTMTRMKIKYQMISVLKFEGPFIRVFDCLQTYQKLTVQPVYYLLTMLVSKSVLHYNQISTRREETGTKTETIQPMQCMLYVNPSISSLESQHCLK